jgi:hypothetical protein
MVHSVMIATDDQALELLNADEFDPWTTALLPPGGEDLVLPGAAGPGAAAHVVEAVPGKLMLDVVPSEDGLLVVSQPFYPGWQARVDGERTPIHRVDYLLQGVPLEAGSHRVELSYQPLRWPAIVSLAVLVGCLTVLILRWRRP